VTDKILAVVPPIAAFVAAGFEHSVANMYFVPIGLLVKDELDVPGLELAHLSWKAFLVDNLVPVTIGNVIGGAVMVGAVYWLVYLREPR
jgi:formate/nitrite transporter FocA (FNT family)